MTLEPYQQKRNFAVTPEPSGQVAPAPGRSFCVQKHRAKAAGLHFDFRLEHGGVLLSWAVPKGPSLEPSVLRFAKEVEPHPVEYGRFEGVIPDGYGAGTVELWDHGWWEPLVDPTEGLKNGRLSFRLHGERLTGRWTLIRTQGRDWLLRRKHE